MTPTTTPLRIADASARYGLSPQTLYTWVRTRKLRTAPLPGTTVTGVVEEDIPALLARSTTTRRGPEVRPGSVRDMQRCRAAALSLDATLGPLPHNADLRRLLVAKVQRIRAAQASSGSLPEESDIIAQAQAWAHAHPLNASEAYAEALPLQEGVGEAGLPGPEHWLALTTRAAPALREALCLRWREALSAQWRYAMALWALHHLEAGQSVPVPPWHEQFPLSLAALTTAAMLPTPQDILAADSSDPTSPTNPTDPYATYHARALPRLLNANNTALIKQGLVPRLAWSHVRVACAAGSVEVTPRGFVTPACMRRLLADTPVAARTIATAAATYPWSQKIPRAWAPGEAVRWEA